MKKISMLLALFVFIGFVSAQTNRNSSDLKGLEQAKILKEKQLTADNVVLRNGAECMKDLSFRNKNIVSKKSQKATAKGAKSSLYDNGSFVTAPGGGPNGSDYSLLESPNNSLGFGMPSASSYSVAEDFTVIGSWTIDSLVLFGYQTNSTLASTFTSYYIQILNGAPDDPNSTVVWGDLTTNVLTSTYFSNCYRGSDGVSTARPIMRNVCATPGLSLSAGTYWVQWSAAGSLTSGPWANPITISGTPATGNAKQYNGSAWADILDGGSTQPQGLPFIVFGTSGSLPTDDAAMLGITQPATGVLTATEAIVVKVANYGSNPIASANVTYKIDNNAPITETATFSTPLATGTSANYTFTATADLSTPGIHNITAWVTYSGDVNTANDTAHKSVECFGPATLPYACGFEPTENLLQWMVEDVNADAKTWTISATGGNTAPAAAKYTYSTPNAANDYLFCPMINYVAGNTYKVTFSYKVQSATYPEKLALLIANAQSSASIIDTVVDLGQIVNTTYQQSIAFFTVPTTGNYSLAWFAYSDPDMYNIFVDDVSIEQLVDNDLAAVSVSGSSTPTQNSASQYIVKVLNNGNLAQSTYNVKLKKAGGIEIATVAGTAIASGATLDFTFNWTPTDTGSSYLYGEVELANDQAPTNNITPNFDVDVQPSGTVVITVGNDVTLDNKLPADFYWKSSLSEVIYQASDLNIGGALTSIAYNSNFVSNITATPLKIWIGETTLTDLSAGWIPSTNLTLAFDGTVDIPAGNATLMFNLTNPYIYAGGNLVIMVERPLDSQYYLSTDKFYYTATPNYPDRALYYYSDTQPADPTNPPAGTLVAAVPNTAFLFNVAGLGGLTGIVKDNNNAPMANVIVKIDSSSAQTITDASGVYNFPYLFEGSKTVRAIKHGYYDGFATVTIVADTTLTQNLTITPLPQVTVTGHVVPSDNISGVLDSAKVELTGYEDYETYTNATGDFTIANVYASNIYNVVITHEGYQVYNGTADVQTANLNLGTITLNEIANPPSGVVAVNNTTNVTLNWNEPGTGSQNQFTYDDGTAENGWSMNPATNGWLGNMFPVTESGQIVSIDVYSQVNASAGTDEVEFEFFDATQASVGTSSSFIPPADSWINVPVANVPFNGTFYAMIHWNNEVAATNYIGFDENGPLAGAGYDWYYDGTAWTLLHVAASSNPGVFMIRVNALVNGKKVSYTLNNNALQVKSTEGKNIQLANNFAQSKKASSAIIKASPRVQTGYNVYRLLASNEANEATWTTIATNLTDTFYVDNSWPNATFGVYEYAVKAVYTNNNLSVPAFSNELPKDMTANVTITLTTNSGDSPAGAVCTLTNIDNDPTHVYTANYPTTGNLVIQNVWKGTYIGTIDLTGFDSEVDSAVVINSDTTFAVQLTETIVTPYGLQIQNLANAQAKLTWNNTSSSAEDFEGGVLPANWQIQTLNTGTSGPLPATWTVNQYTNTDVTPHSGVNHAGLWWDYADQDEWLITPSFTCAGNTDLTFWTAVYEGSTNGDHYYVKVSTDGGTTWNAIWDASTLTGAAWNYYATPYTIDLAQFAGQNIKVAFNAQATGGLWYIWFVDDISIGSGAKQIKFSASDLTTSSNSHKATVNTNSALTIARDGKTNSIARSLTHYNVYLDGTSVATTNDNFHVFSNLVNGQSYLAGVSATFTTGTSPIDTIRFTYRQLAQVTVNVTTNVTGTNGAGAFVSLTGLYNYSDTADANGAADFPGVEQGNYVMTVSLDGFNLFTDSNVVINGNTTIPVQLIETIVAPYGLMVENGSNGQATLSWNNSTGSAEDFEGGSLPTDWTIQTLNTGTSGPLPATWTINQYTNTDVTPHSGANHAGLWWDYADQDEWLITPSFTCAANTDLTFWTAVYEGSTNGDHYYVKVSTDGGTTWTEVWDASTLAGAAWNYYATPYTIDLAQFAGQNIKVAFQAQATGGLWYIWFIDDVSVASGNKAIKFSAKDLTSKSLSHRSDVNRNSTLAISRDGKVNSLNSTRSFVGYNVFLNNMTNPIASNITGTSYNLTNLVDGQTYLAGVSATYSSGTSEIDTLRFTYHQAASVTVNITTNAGSAVGAVATLTGTQIYTATADANGTALFAAVEQGTYTLTVSLNGFDLFTQANVVVTGNTTIAAQLVETIVAPFGLTATEIGNSTVKFAWNQTIGGVEDFEGGALPTDWTIQTLNTGTSGPLPATWTINQYTNTDVTPHSGANHAGLWWDYADQDEWLITEQVTVPANGKLKFWSAVYEGSTNGDHYYVKVSTDGGTTWTELWDASTLTGAAWNYYATPYEIDLASYAGQNVKVAFQAQATGGLWYIWFVDDVEISNGVKSAKLAFSSISSNSNRSFQNYTVYKDNVQVGTTTTTDYNMTGLVDNTTYTFGVKSNYTSGSSAIVNLVYAFVSVNDLQAKAIAMYPVPAKDVLHIVAPYNVSNITITNTLGQVVYNTIPQNSTIDINTASFESGIYFIKMNTEKGIVNTKFSVTK